jgi:hypothetical protein
VNRSTGEVLPTGARDPDLTSDDDFHLLWDNVCEGKGLDIPTGRSLLDGLMERYKQKEESDAEYRQFLLDKLRAQSPDSIAKIKQRAAQRAAPATVAPSGAVPPFGETANAPAPSSDAEPDVAGADTEPPADALDPVVDPWLEETRRLAFAKNPDEEAFHRAMVHFIKGFKRQNVIGLTSKERKEIRNAIEETRGWFAYLAGK